MWGWSWSGKNVCGANGVGNDGGCANACGGTDVVGGGNNWSECDLRAFGTVVSGL